MENLQLKSLVTDDGYLELLLETAEVPDPGDDEVVVEMHASPINPSDMGMLFASADMTTAEAAGTSDSPVVRAKIPEAMHSYVAPRVGKALVCGNEGAGVVVSARVV